MPKSKSKTKPKPKAAKPKAAKPKATKPTKAKAKAAKARPAKPAKPTKAKPRVATKTKAAAAPSTKKRAAGPGDAALVELRAFGLAYPGTHLKSPWPGHLDLAVNDKTFAYLSIEGEPFSISVKLPDSSHVALLLPCCKPAAYGLGKSGWVSATFDAEPPVDMLKQWIDESYRAQAPKRLVKQLDAAAGTTA